MFFTEGLAENLDLCAQWFQEGVVDSVWHLYSARGRHVGMYHIVPDVSLGMSNKMEIFLEKCRHFT